MFSSGIEHYGLKIKLWEMLALRVEMDKEMMTMSPQPGEEELNQAEH